MKERLSLETWANIIRNLSEEGQEVEVVWLDDENTYCLCFDCEMFEQGFSTETEAEARIEEVLTLLKTEM